jgi:hypothetical protein
MLLARGRFWLEAAAAIVSLVILLLTLVAPNWIEFVFGIDPDHHSGSLEWLIVAASAAVTISSAALARHELRAASARA